jgi:hypothetical protein
MLHCPLFFGILSLVLFEVGDLRTHCTQFESRMVS